MNILVVKIKSLVFLFFVAGFIGCINSDPEFNAQKLIENYDRAKVKEFLVDSLLLLNNEEWKIYNSYLENFGLEPLESKEDIDKLDVLVVPVLDLSKEVLDYDYSQNIIQYLHPLFSDWYENYKSFVFYDDHMIGALFANKKPGKHWTLWDTTPYNVGESYFNKVIENHRDRFFYCQTIMAFCYIDSEQLYVCLPKLNKDIPFEEFSKEYFSLKVLRERIERREKYLDEFADNS
ncbi:hypothetical protein [Sunxiuqinia elliptica]|uniref:Lipoprotein n=1 Tax=Sunxiuqinia elliptica TaxID=655355 RepID=A0A1I2CP61_9BACT|nr:hypothetical protein [Sunxiuqinia elliptica]SFE69935.1 hypothetical protein SAMN05216283_101787 [Sunxiuqinia elliptica]